MTELPSELEQIVRVALGEEGQAETPKGSNRGPRIDIYRAPWRRKILEQQDLIARPGGPVRGCPWCAWYVTWCWLTALGKNPLGRQIGGCHALAARADELDLWVPLDGKPPTALIGAYPGCAFVMLDKPWVEGPSEGHTGIVTGVSEDGLYVSTIEGNSGDAVRRGRRYLYEPRMRGLVLPLGVEHAYGKWPRGLLDGADLSKLGTR